MFAWFAQFAPAQPMIFGFIGSAFTYSISSKQYLKPNNRSRADKTYIIMSFGAPGGAAANFKPTPYVHSGEKCCVD